MQAEALVMLVRKASKSASFSNYLKKQRHPSLSKRTLDFARLYQLLRDESIGIHAMQVINGDMLDMVKKASKLQASMFLFDFIACHVPMTVHTNFIMASSRVYVADVFQGFFFF